MRAQPVTWIDDLHARMLALYPRTHGPECADKYFAIAEWWRLHAEENRAPEACLETARCQEAKARALARLETGA